jgi:hypothetical protein
LDRGTLDCPDNFGFKPSEGGTTKIRDGIDDFRLIIFEVLGGAGEDHAKLCQERPELGRFLTGKGVGRSDLHLRTLRGLSTSLAGSGEGAECFNQLSGDCTSTEVILEERIVRQGNRIGVVFLQLGYRFESVVEWVGG